MDAMRRVLALIPARGGSKGLPGKNIRPLLGKPLIEWTIARALESHLVTKVVVSTDSEEIAEIGRLAGAEVPFLRPAYLATDESMIGQTVDHCLCFFGERGEHFDDILLLEPTSPLRTYGQIDHVIEFYWQRRAHFDGVVTVGESRSNPVFMKTMIGDRLHPYDSRLDQTQRRQDNPCVLYPFGVAYISSIAAFRESLSFYPPRLAGFRLERYQEYEIDDLYDYLAVEGIMRYEWSQVERGVCENWVRSYVGSVNRSRSAE